MSITNLSIGVAFSSDVGMKRDHNEDNFCVVSQSLQIANSPTNITTKGGEGVLLAVADGMGGANAGEVASALAVENVLSSGLNLVENNTSSDISAALKRLILESHSVILKASSSNPAHSGMGTTLVVAYVRGNRVQIAWCGDSRAYLFNAAGVNRAKSYDLPRMRIITNDHSLVWDMVLKGELSPEQARTHEYSNIITQSLGDPNHDPKPESRELYIRPGDKLILCSDGLNSMLPDEQIEELLAHTKGDQKVVDELIAAANDAGGHDNVTAIVVSIKEAPVVPLEATIATRPEVVTQASRRDEKGPIVPASAEATDSTDHVNNKSSDSSRRNLKPQMIAFIVIALLSLVIVYLVGEKLSHDREQDQVTSLDVVSPNIDSTIFSDNDQVEKTESKSAQLDKLSKPQNAKSTTKSKGKSSEARWMEGRRTECMDNWLQVTQKLDSIQNELKIAKREGRSIDGPLNKLSIINYTLQQVKEDIQSAKYGTEITKINSQLDSINIDLHLIRNNIVDLPLQIRELATDTSISSMDTIIIDNN